MKKIRVIMCDDEQSICDYFMYAFKAAGDIEFAGCANNKHDSKELIKNTPCDIVLLDVQMDTAETGLELIPYVKSYRPEAKIIMMTVHEETEYIFRAFQDGISDYFLKTLPSEELIKSIRAAYENNLILRPAIAQKIIEQGQIIAKRQKKLEEEHLEVKNNQKSLLYILNLMTKLSTSEFEILKGFYYGKTAPEMAKERYVSESTIRTHSGRILKKFNYANMKKLVADLRRMKAFSIFDE